VRLTLGPLSHEQFRRFLPGGPAALALRELLTLLTGVSLEYEIRLALRAAEVKGLRLSEDQGARLAWDAFLITRAVRADRHDAGYEIHAVA
jgi:type VI secretion system protein ImpH